MSVFLIIKTDESDVYSFECFPEPAQESVFFYSWYKESHRGMLTQFPCGYLLENQYMENVELKASLNNTVFEEIYLKLYSIGARKQKSLNQKDVYIHSFWGRLKLRIENESNQHAIYYFRANENNARQSNYFIVDLSNVYKYVKPFIPFLRFLRKGEVIKNRELWMLDNIRIHLDCVENLGSFIEFEAVQNDQTNRHDDHARIYKLMNLLDIDTKSILKHSYLDLSTGRD